MKIHDIWEAIIRIDSILLMVDRVIVVLLLATVIIHLVVKVKVEEIVAEVLDNILKKSMIL